MSEFKRYRRKATYTEMRPYIMGEDMSGISVSDADTPTIGGMIARNPDNHEDQWYVALKYFATNFEPESNYEGVRP